MNLIENTATIAAATPQPKVIPSKYASVLVQVGKAKTGKLVVLFSVNTPVLESVYFLICHAAPFHKTSVRYDVEPGVKSAGFSDQCAAVASASVSKHCDLNK